MLIATVRFMPILWVAGVDFIAMVLAALLSGRRWSAPFFTAVALVAVCVLVGSAIRYFVAGGELTRFVGALNNAAIIASAIRAFHVFVSQPRLASQMGRALRWPVMFGLGLFITLFMVSAAGLSELSFPSLFGLITGGGRAFGALLGRYEELYLLVPEWLAGMDGSLGRVSVLGPYPNSSTAVLVLLCFCRLFYLASLGQRSAERWVLEAGIVVITLLSYSRISVIGWGLGLAVIVLAKPGRRPFLAVLLFLLASSVVVALPLILDAILSLKSGSSEGRQALYQFAINRVWQDAPLFGVGAKTTDSIFGATYPIGSHSTPVSVLYRGGIVGLVTFSIAFYVMPFVALLLLRARMAERLWSILVRAAVFIFMWSLVEDIDVHPPVMILCAYLGAELYRTYQEIYGKSGPSFHPSKIWPQHGKA